MENNQLKLFGLFISSHAKFQGHPSERHLGKLRTNLTFSEAENIQPNNSEVRSRASKVQQLELSFMFNYLAHKSQIGVNA